MSALNPGAAPTPKKGKRRVTRGLLTTQDRHTPFRPTKTAREKTERMMSILMVAAPRAYAWREAWQTFKRYSGGDHDLYGRRLLDGRSIAKAKYVARVSYRAWKGRAVPQGRGWANLRTALNVVFSALT